MSNYDEDDFLDSLMEDVMGSSKEKDDEENEEKDDDINESEDVEKSEDEDIEEELEEVEVIEDVPPKRQGGLLSRLSGGDDTNERGSSEADVGGDPESESTSGNILDIGGEDLDVKESFGEVAKTTSEQEETSSSEGSGVGLSLLERMRARASGSEVEVEVEGSSQVESEEDSEGPSDSLSVQDEESTFESQVEDDLLASSQDDSLTSSQDDSLTSSQDDSFASMLDGLDVDEDIDEARRRAELDEDVEIPLDKPGMDEIIVTPDGKSLSDMLPSLRGGQKKATQVIDEIRSQDKVVEVGGKKFSDDRYTKHVEVIDEERARDEERVKLSSDYLQRNAKFTEQEKIIMRNLGLTNEQLAGVMRSQELSMREKEELIALGRYGSERHFKGKRYRTTVGDTAMLEFLTKFKFANTRILRWVSHDSQLRAWRKLNRLRDSGLVESKSIIGIPDLWGATPAGVAISGYAYEPGLRPMPKMFTISSNMGVNYIAACLWFNTINVLNLSDFPASNRVISLQDDGRDRVRGEMLVSEYEIRSSLGKEISPQATTMKTLGDERLYDVISSNVRQEVEEWESRGKLGDGPETWLGNEYMWVLYPTSQLTLSYHVPDLVVKRERGPNGEPRSIAVEMERFDKSNDRYDKIMLAYKLDEHLYEKVVWITPNMRVARALERAADEVGFDRYSILPIITEDGVFDKQDIWMI